MTSRTGTKPRIAFSVHGFTLVEVMLATVILALGTIFLSQSFFITLDSYNYCSRYLQVLSWADEKVWEAEESLSRLGPATVLDNAGVFTEKGRNFKWYRSYSPLGADGSLYKIDFEMSWQEGARKVRIQRGTYARYEKKEE